MLKVAGGAGGGGSGTVTNIATGTGLTGGPITSTGTISLTNTAVTAASYGNASTVGSFTVNAQGQLTAASNSTISISVSAVSGAVPNTVNVIAGTGLTGGGALTGNVTLSVTANSVNQKVAVQNNGVAVGSEPVINFIPGTSVTITTADDSGNSRSNVTIGLSNNQITLGNTVMSLANTTSTVGNLTLNNVTINSGTVAINVANVTTTTAASATFATSSLPLVPAGYLSVNLNGTVVKVPYYAV